MPWIYFDESDRRSPAPDLNLEQLHASGSTAANSAGERISIRQFYEQAALVLIFLPDAEHPEVELAPFFSRSNDYLAQNAHLLAILPAEAQVERAPFPLLVDREGQARLAYAALLAHELWQADQPALFVLDAYGALWAAYIAAHLDDPNLPDELLSRLSYIGIQCPE